MNAVLQQLDSLLKKAKEQGLGYLHRIADRPTTAEFQAVRRFRLPFEGIGAPEALNQFNSRFEPLIVKRNDLISQQHQVHAIHL